MLQITIVTYKTTLNKCESLNSLCKYIDKLEVPYSILIVNNSPEIQLEDSPLYTIFTPTENLMLAKAYNAALSIAKKNGHEWMMLLDQDTTLTEDYIVGLNNALKSKIDTSIAAIVPVVKYIDGIHQISPATYNPTFGTVNAKMLKPCIVSGKSVLAINSCSVVRITAIESIGGFPEMFPLDGLDTAYYYQFYKHGWDVQVIDAVIFQNLSVFDYKHNMSDRRYQSILKSELDLVHIMGTTATITLKLKYLGRIVIQLFDSGKRKYVKQTAAALLK